MSLLGIIHVDGSCPHSTWFSFSSDDINNAVKSLVAAVGSNWRTVFGSSLDAYGVTGVEAKENSGDDDNAVSFLV